MSSSRVINTLKNHSLVFPANRPDMSHHVRACKLSIAEARLCPNLLYTGWTGMFLFKFLFPVWKHRGLYNRVGFDTFGPSEGKHQCMEMQWHCMFANWKGVAYSIKVSASTWLCVSKVDGTQVLPLVSVPDVTMNFLNVFVGPLLWPIVFAAWCVVSSASALIFERKSFREIIWIKVVSKRC